MDYKKIHIKQVAYYYLIEKLGKGTSGTVYLAVDDKKDELVAIKQIPLVNLKKRKRNGNSTKRNK